MKLLFGDIYEEYLQLEERNKRADPSNMRYPLRETIMILFPSIKEGAALRLYKKHFQNEKSSSEVVVQIAPEYEELIFKVQPNLKQIHDTYTGNDFWGNVICAANDDQINRSAKLGVQVKDEFKDVRNIIQDLNKQIVYKYSPLAKKLTDALSTKVTHKDLLTSHLFSDYNARHKSFKSIADYNIQRGVQSSQLAYVSEAPPNNSSFVDGIPPAYGDLPGSDKGFVLLR